MASSLVYTVVVLGLLLSAGVQSSGAQHPAKADALNTEGSTQHCTDAGCSPRHSVWTQTRSSTCQRKWFDRDSFVCVCSGSSCDFPGLVPHPEDSSSFTVVTSDRAERRFEVSHGVASTEPAEGSTVLLIAPAEQQQTMLGFGGSFSDSSGLNILSLSAEAQDTLIDSYFSPEGIRYTIGRIPIAGSDFSTRPYSYADVEGDMALEHFALAEEDLKYKIPILERAMAAQGATSSPLLLVASPWSPPHWMKTNNKINGSGGLLPHMWQAYTDYILKFVEAYTAHGISLWGLTTQNEPLCGLREDMPFNACIWLAEDMRRWITDYLGPALRAAGHQDMKLIISDQVRTNLQEYSAEILKDEEASGYVDGMGIHWYTDKPGNVDTLTNTHAQFPDKFLLYTEACEGSRAPHGEKVKMGDWGRAETYAGSIIETCNHHVVGWLDWNIALDLEGGPNWAGNFVDSPIIVDAASDVFYKQPMFYAMGHFSKFVDPGARSVAHSLTEGDVQATVFVMEAGRVVVVLMNTADTEQPVTVDPGTGSGIVYHLQLPARSIQTVLLRL